MVGFGLIGSSIARAVRHRKACANRSWPSTGDEARSRGSRELGLADEATSDVAEGVRGADLRDPLRARGRMRRRRRHA